MQNLKVANQVLFRDLFEGYNLGHCLSESSEKMLQRGKRGDRIYTKWFVCFFSGGEKKKKHAVESQKVTANHKEETSQVHDFNVFLCLGRGSAVY